MLSDTNIAIQRKNAEQMYQRGRSNLLWVIALTVINIVLAFAGSETMLLFSATVPYFMAVLGIFAENSAVLTVCAGISAFILLLYLLCWWLSKKHIGWLIAALVMFVIDTAMMIWFYVISGDISGVLDLVIHIMILYYLFNGVRFGLKLRKLPENSVCIDADDDTDDATVENSPSLYMADTTVKSRILLETSIAGHTVCYRRVNRVNELIIDGYVYDHTAEMLIEPQHNLSATLDGNLIEVGYDGRSSYAKLNGSVKATKLRIW